jgi:hypothetical protein
LNALKSDVDEVVLQGIEFWSNVCDEEVDLAIEASEFGEMGRPPMNTSRFYAKGALSHVLPVLLPILMRQVWKFLFHSLLVCMYAIPRHQVVEILVIPLARTWLNLGLSI